MGVPTGLEFVDLCQTDSSRLDPEGGGGKCQRGFCYFGSYSEVVDKAKEVPVGKYAPYKRVFEGSIGSRYAICYQGQDDRFDYNTR